MLTTDDLRAVLMELEPDEVHADRVLAALRSELPQQVNRRGTQTPRRRWMAPVAAAVAVAAVGAVIIVLTGGGGSGVKQQAVAAGGSMSPTRYAFAVATLPGGLVAKYAGTATEGQGAYVFDANGDEVAVIDVYAPNTWHPSRPADAVAVSVSGQPGWYGTFDQFEAPGPFWSASAENILLWQDASGLWASILPFSQSHTSGRAAPPILTKQQTIDIAQAITMGDHGAARVPVRSTTLPTGLVVRAIQYGPFAQSDGASIEFATAATTSARLGIDVFAASANITNGSGPPDPPTPVTAGQFHGSYYANSGHVDVTNGTIRVIVSDLSDSGIHPSSLQFIDMINGMTFASSLTDQTTWFNATSAFTN